MNKDKLLNCISKTNCWTAFRFDVYPVVKSKTTIKNRWELCENICRFLCFIFWKQNYWLSKNRSRFFLPLGSGGVFAFPFERDLLTWSVSLVIQACVNCYIFCTFLLNRVQNSEKKKINEHSECKPKWFPSPHSLVLLLWLMPFGHWTKQTDSSLTRQCTVGRL